MGANMLRTILRRIYPVSSMWCRLRHDRSGSVVGLLVVLPVVIGAVALGVETGQAYRIKRQMQGASDAAALSGAIDRMAGKDNATITATARYETQRNGFQNGVSGVTVTVNAPPTSGSNMSTAGAVEVIVTKSFSFSLGAVLANSLGLTNSAFNIRARSVAAQSSYTSTTTSAEGCVVALTTAAEQGVSLTSFNNYTSDCTVMSNGSSTSSGSSASVYMASFNNATLKSVWTRGRFSAASYGSISLTNAAQENQTSYITDPYTSLPTPSPGACTYNPFSAPGGTAITLNPGTYCGGLTISSYNNVYFTPGVYYVANGDLYMTSINNVSCPTCDSTNGVAIVLTQTTGNNADIGGVRITSENNVDLKASPTGTYAGVLFYQDRRADVGTMTSSSKIFTVSSLNNAKLAGAVYFPNNRIDLSSLNNASPGNTSCNVWIGRYIKFSSYNNSSVTGCGAVGTTLASVTTTTTTNKGKLFE